MNTPDPQLNRLAFYQTRIASLEETIRKLQLRSARISRSRLMVFVLTLLPVYFTWNEMWYWTVLVLVTGIALFIYLVHQTRQTDLSLLMQKNLLMINQNEVLSMQGRFDGRPDGNEYLLAWGLDNDLDRFGKNSLFQLINRAESQQGREIMSRSLTAVSDLAGLKIKQQAIQELRDQIDWRQGFRGHMLQHQISIRSQELLRYWITSSGQANIPSTWKILIYLLPVVSTVMTLAYTFDFISRSAFISYLILAFIVAVYFGKIANWWFKHLSSILQELETLLPAIRMIEGARFNSPLLLEFQLKVNKPESVSASLNELRKILARYDYRLNPVVYLPLNFLLWWDLRQVMALHRWRQSHKGNTDDWFEVLGQFEYLNSYANLAFNQPHWTFPEWSEHWHEFKAVDLGHPLIPAGKAVTNDFLLKDPQRIALITGSNMAGKSTFLRSLGSNVLIAMAGGPVFAKSCTLCPCFILSSMRISDNLQEETSTFYAELKKIKIILESVTAGQHVLVLIDEMLRGTNTLDREKGSRAFIRQLIRYRAVAVIASHDTGLAAIREDFPGVIDNYYFDSVVVGEEIRFDYKIKPGVCTQTNASYLMRKMGIELKEE